MNAEKFFSSMQLHVGGVALDGNNFAEQHDNDSRYTGKKIKKESRDVQLIQQTYESTNMNIIVNMWNYLDQKERKKTNLKQEL